MDKHLLERFIKGDCTTEEVKWVQEWLAQHPEALDAYLQEIWNEEITTPMPAAMEQALLKEAETMPGFRNEAPSGSAITNRWLYWPAAALVILSITAWWVWAHVNKPKQGGNLIKHQLVITAPADKNYRFVLPDQSVVWLKEGARLQVDTQTYNKSLRTVQLLAGEVFFEVQKDPVHPFVLQHGRVETRVLGTSFSVATVTPNEAVVITVATGKVQVSHDSKVLDVLLPGKQISVQSKTGEFSETIVPVWLASLWKEEEIQLTNAHFNELTLALEKIYGVTIQTNNAIIKKKNYNIRLNKKMPAQEVIQVLALLNHQQFKKLNQTTWLLY
jgi:transmembrane sensor